MPTVKGLRFLPWFVWLATNRAAIGNKWVWWEAALTFVRFSKYPCQWSYTMESFESPDHWIPCWLIQVFQTIQEVVHTTWHRGWQSPAYFPLWLARKQAVPLISVNLPLVASSIWWTLPLDGDDALLCSSLLLTATWLSEVRACHHRLSLVSSSPLPSSVC